MRESVERYASLVEVGRRARWVAVVVFAVVVSGFEAVGAILIFALVSLASDPQGSLEVPLLGDLRALEGAVPEGDGLVTATAVVVAVFFVLRAVVVLAQTYYQAYVANLASVDLAERLLDRYLHLPYAFHLQRNSSQLIRNANESTGEILGSILMPSVQLISEGLMVTALLVVLVTTAPWATAITVLVLTPLVLLILRVVQPRIRHLGAISQHEGGRSLQALQQSLHGYRDITVLGVQDFFLTTYRDSRAVIARTRYLRQMFAVFPRVSIEAVVIGLIAIFLVTSTVVGDGAQDSLAVLSLFGYAALRIMPATNKIVGHLTSIRYGRAALDDVLADLALPVAPWGTGDGAARLRFSDALVLEDVTFRYDGTEATALHDINLTIQRGESVGIVGPTGSGKSTLIDLIVGLSIPSRGRITVDGVDLRDQAPAWQRSVGMVSQQIFLLDDTLRGNIALGVTAGDIDETRLMEVVQLAQLQEFVDGLPAGLDTMVGERGIRVSGGQRQRIAIARALYRRPDVLVFDEGTSALDNLTEAMLVAALSQLNEDHTIITVAHRLSTVKDYDRVVFLRDGRIVDVGPFDVMLRRNVEFQQLARWSGSARA